MNQFNRNRKENAAKIIMARISQGVNQYEEAVREMTDTELWDHCFNNPSMPEDFCMQEWQRRDTACICPTEIRTGWIEVDGKACCNICEKVQLGETLTNR